MKKLLIYLLIPAAIIASLAACAGENAGAPGTGEISIYRVVREEYRLDSELVRAEKLSFSDEGSVVQGAAAALKSAPENPSLESALPPGVAVISAERIGKTVYVYMNGAYGDLSGMDKTIADSCIALTMCSIPGVDLVTIYAAGKAAQTRLTSDDLLLRNTLTSATQAEVRLYFPQAENPVLAAEYRPVTVSGDISSERIVIDELLNGPTSEKLRPALPEGTGNPSVYTQDGVCTVSFSEDFLRAFENDAEGLRLAIYSVVNSLTSLTEIDSVMIIIQNNENALIGGIDISEPLTRKTSMIGSAVID